MLDYRLTQNPNKRADLIINWEDTTFRQKHNYLNKLDSKQQILNINCSNISKERVYQVHQLIFGYKINIDPQNYKGLCVQKSNENATHDGIIKCPLKDINNRFVYQIVINNQINENHIEDIRVPIFGDIIPHCYLKHRNIKTRFSNENLR